MTTIATPTPALSVSRPKGKLARRLRGRVIDAIAVIVLIVGCMGLAWPWVSVRISAHEAAERVSAQQAAVGNLTSEQRAEELKKAQAYNDSLTGEPVTDPFVPGSGAALPSLEKYNDALNVNGDGIMGSLEIPMIGVRLPIAHDTEEDTLQHAAGHVRQTSLPIGGKGTHAVIAAHRGLANAEMFTRLNEMRVGDTFTITVLDETMTYQVDQISVVTPEDLSKIAIESDRDLVTLMTCTPYGVNTHRLLVRGTRIPNAAAPEPRTSIGIEHMVRLAGLILGVLLAIWLVWFLRRRKRRATAPTIIRHRNA